MNRLLVLIGSGETSPTAVTLHQDLRRICGGAPVLLVETPYGFQENAGEVTAKASRYFSRSAGAQVEVAPGMRAPAEEPGPDRDRGIAALRAAPWAFAGPGSPTYAIRQWQRSPVGRILCQRVRREGVTVLASAAACLAGRVGLPVYEVYKAGLPPAWVGALDVLAEAGIAAAVIPHYDNAEGGTHDTRYCYMGERRLLALEAQLPPGVGVLGVDEHTALLIDLEAGSVTVRGKGAMTLRRAGVERRVPAGTAVGVEEVRALLAAPAAARTAPPEDTPAPAAEAPPTLEEIAAGCERRFVGGERRGDVGPMVDAIVELHTAVVEWATDTDVDVAEAVEAVLRSLVVRLGRRAGAGMEDPRRRIAPLVAPVVAIRERLRARAMWDLADELRDALAAGGVEVRDTRAGPAWGPARR